MIRSFQLADVCSRLDPEIKNYFRGIFTPDTVLPGAVDMIDPNKPNFLIFNTDYSHKEGSHWVAAYINLDKESYFIDSFSQHPNQYDLEDFWLEVNNSDYKTLPKPLQSSYTNVCGLYVVFFGHYLCKGYDMSKILELIPDRSKVLRDRYILEWFERNYGKSIKLDTQFIDCKKFQKSGRAQSCKNFQKMILDRQNI